MNPFNFYNPTQIVFGKDRLEELDGLIPQGAKVLVTYGGGSAKRNGTLEKVQSGLKGRTIIEFGGIEANPQFNTLIKAVEIVKKENVDFLLAVGGGSVMDGTKFISLASKVEEKDYASILFHGFEGYPGTESVPLGCVVTLPATGSESNPASVITYNDQKYPVMSPLTFPKFSFLDINLTKSLPKEQVANGVADAFVHVIEQYLTFPVGGLVQDRMAEGILKTLIEIGPTTLENPEDENARENFVWSATMALNGIIGVGVPQDWATHMIGHELTAMYGIAHGRTLTIVLPSLLRARKEQKKAKLLQYARRVWDIQGDNEDQVIEEAIQKTEGFFNSLGIVTKLSGYDINRDDIKTIVGNMEKMGLTALSEHQDMGLDQVTSVLEAAY